MSADTTAPNEATAECASAAAHLAIAEFELVSAARFRGSVRAVRDSYPIGSVERGLVARLVRTGDRRVRKAIRKSYDAGMSVRELADVVGVKPDRIRKILRP